MNSPAAACRRISVTFRLLIALVAVSAAGAATAQNTALVLDEIGKASVYHSPADATFTAGNNNTNSVYVNVSRSGGSGSSSYYSLSFNAPNGAFLQPGVYENTIAFSSPSSTRPGLAVYPSGGGITCSGGSNQTGRFEVKEIVYGASGSDIIAFHATFSVSCGTQPDGLTGEVLINSASPVPPRNHLTGRTSVFGTNGQPFSHRVTASNSPSSFTASPLPPGLTLNASTGLISGTPTTEGAFVVDVTATGATGAASGKLNVTIDPPTHSRGPFTALFVNSAPGDPVGKGQTRLLRETDGEFSGSAGPRSAFVSFYSPDRSTSWNLAFEVAFNRTLQVGTYKAARSASGDTAALNIFTNGGSCGESSGEFEIKELASADNKLTAFRATFIQTCGSASSAPLKGAVWFRSGLAVTSSPYATAMRDTSFTHQLVANNEPTGFTASGLPPGLTLDGSAGVISGSPTVSGTYTVLVRAAGKLGAAEGTLTLAVAVPPGAAAPPAITSPGKATVKRGDQFSYQITATNSATQFSVIGLPDGLVLDSATGQITGNSSVAGTFGVVLMATNTATTGGGSLVLSVTPPPPVFTSESSAVAVQARPFAFQFAATEEPTSFDETGLPVGLTMNSSGLISGTTFQTGSFSVAVVARNAGGTGSQNFTLTVDPATQFANVSTRLRVESGENVLIGGFIVTGTKAKNVIVRAIGPSLSVDGVPVAGRLEDPELELFRGPTWVAYNDNWRSPDGGHRISATTIPPQDDRESAMVRQLQPGAYTAIVRGKGNTAGVALVEVYDLDPLCAEGLMANISTRGLIRAGDTMIGGLIVRGNASQRAVVRAMGPTLQQAGISQPLQNPTLELVDGNGSSIAFNNDWQDNQADEITASGFAPGDPRESTIITSLSAGNYTAVVRGSGEAAGVALVEVYRLD